MSIQKKSPKSNPIVCSSISGKIGGLGVLMHNKAYKEAKINASYISFEPSSAKDAIEAMKNLGFRGMGVSMPYKVDIIKYLDKLDDTAKQIGAVNTIVNDEGILTGYNTDYKGAIDALKQEIDLNGKKVALFGCGGVARAILYGLNLEKAETVVFARNKQNGLSFCTQMNAKFGGSISDYNKDESWDVIINATSVGFQTKETLLKQEDFNEKTVVLDVVFKPKETEFLKEAKKANCKTVSGVKMIILQAIAQDELYLGIRPSYNVMLEALNSY